MPRGACKMVRGSWREVTGTWQDRHRAHRAIIPRHAAPLLADGRVLVAGGWNVHVIPGAEIFDSTSGTWSTTGRLITGRDQHASAVLPDGRVLVAGGLDRNNQELESAEAFSP